jgi:transcription antitermination factor NusA-like protein
VEQPINPFQGTDSFYQQADETTISVPMPAGLERGALIGKQGAYAQRLESKYSVRINFPRADSAEDGDNAISIRGGKKGVDGAKKELLELMDYEKENNQSTTINVPGRALARVIGRQGAAIREVQNDTGAEIDISKKDSEKPGSDAVFTIRGTKAAIAAAKKAITGIVSEVQDEVTFEIPIERSAHASIVGRGGQNRELALFLILL